MSSWNGASEPTKAERHISSVTSCIPRSPSIIGGKHDSILAMIMLEHQLAKFESCGHGSKNPNFLAWLQIAMLHLGSRGFGLVGFTPVSVVTRGAALLRYSTGGTVVGESWYDVNANAI